MCAHLGRPIPPRRSTASGKKAARCRAVMSPPLPSRQHQAPAKPSQSWHRGAGPDCAAKSSGAKSKRRRAARCAARAATTALPTSASGQGRQRRTLPNACGGSTPTHLHDDLRHGEEDAEREEQHRGVDGQHVQPAHDAVGDPAQPAGRAPAGQRVEHLDERQADLRDACVRVRGRGGAQGLVCVPAAPPPSSCTQEPGLHIACCALAPPSRSARCGRR